MNNGYLRFLYFFILIDHGHLAECYYVSNLYFYKGDQVIIYHISMHQTNLKYFIRLSDP